MNLKLFYQQDPNIQLGLLRQWIGSRKNKPLSINKQPVWVQFIRRELIWCVDELLVHPVEQTQLNWRDDQGRGFLHYGIYARTPHQTMCMGLSQLDHTWNDPDKLGHTPMDIYPHPILAQRMAARWWTMYTDPKNNQIFFEQLSKDAFEAGFKDTARVWDFWTKKQRSVEIQPEFDKVDTSRETP